MSNQDWERLGRYVVARREELGLSQPAVAAQGGPSVANQRNIEKGLKTTYRGGTLQTLARILGWASDSIESILSGGEPTLIQTDETESFDPELPVIRVGLPKDAGDATEAELEEIRANAEAAVLKIWREIKRDRP